MGKVNVVRPDGTVVSVDEELANAGEFARPETVSEEQHRQYLANRDRGTAGLAVPAGILAGLDTATFGVSGRILNAVGEKDEEGNTPYQALLQSHPTATGIGELGGLAVDPFGTVGGVGAAAKAVTGSKVAARAVEGAAIGVGAHIADANVTGDQLTVEGIVEGAGIGALINMGAGALGDGLKGAAARSKAYLAESKASADLVETGKKLFSEESPTWSQFRDAHEASQYAYNDANRIIRDGNETYAKFVGSNAKLTGAIKSAESAINEVSSRYLPLGSPTTLVSETGGAEIGFADQRPRISQELSDRLQSYRERISRTAYKLKGGGWETDYNGKWIRNPSAPADPARALEELRGIQQDIVKDFPKASGRLKDLPPPPTSQIPYEAVDLPDSLRSFARMHEENVARLANSMDPTVVSSFGRVMDEVMGDGAFASSATPAEAVAGFHRKLGEYLSAVDKEAASASASSSKSGGVLAWMRSGLKNAAANVAGFVAYGATGGGILGVAAAAGTRSVLRGAMTDVEDSILGGAMVQAKAGIKQRVAELMGKYGESVGGRVEKIGPVLSYLGQTFPSGEKDHGDIREMAARRMTEIAATAATAPDTMYAAVQPMLGQPSDIGWKIHQAVVGAVQYLNSTLPQDPGMAMKGAKSSWTPAYTDLWALAHRLEAIMNPMGAVSRLLAGQGHPAGAEALRAAYPAIVQELASNAPEVMASFSKAAGFSTLFGLSQGFQNPIISQALQGMYLPKGQPSTPGSSSRATGNPTGRPPAVQSNNNPSLTLTQNLQAH